MENNAHQDASNPGLNMCRHVSEGPISVSCLFKTTTPEMMREKMMALMLMLSARQASADDRSKIM